MSLLVLSPLRRWATGLAGLGLLLVGASCEKVEIRDLKRSTDQQLGRWQVTEIKTVTADSLGKVLSTKTVADQGTMEFQLPLDPVPFNRVRCEGPCVGSDLVGYFRNAGAGEATTTGGWALYWDADPNNQRLQFWGIKIGGSLHRMINLERDGDSHQRLTYIITSKLKPAQRVITTLDLRK